LLIITEKPSVARNFADALGAVSTVPFEFRTKDNQYKITHCVGHLLSMWEAYKYDIRMRNWKIEYLPVIPENFKYQVIEKTARVLEKVRSLIQEAMGKNEEIMVATDAGREGEVIARLVLSYASADEYKKMSRFWSSESTAEKSVVLKGIEDRKKLEYYDDLAREGLLWKKCDWIYGINLTVLFTLVLQAQEGFRGKEVLNFGRVQTAVLYEIYRREREIKDFKEKKYVELEISMEDDLKAYLVKPNYETKEEKIFDENSEYVRKVSEEIRAKKVKSVFIENVKREREVEEPPYLYSTSELFKDCFKLYKFSPAKTLGLMQELYEKRGAITYPRTPSRVLGEGNEKKAQEWLEIQLENEKIIGRFVNKDKYTLKNKRLFNDEKLDDHHGLVPVKYLKEEDTDEYKVWRLIQLRFLMQGMLNYEKEKIKIICKMAGYVFIGNYNMEIIRGWKSYEKNGREDEEESEEIKCLRMARSGVIKVINGYNIRINKTKPPRLHNYSSIISFMRNPKDEEEGKLLIGLGTEATRAAHIEGLELNNLIEGRKDLKVTSKGQKLLKLIENCEIIKSNISAKETTQWEILGKSGSEELLRKTKEVVKETVNYFKKEIEEGRLEDLREVIGKCPMCKKNVYEDKKTYYCEDYKRERKCKYMIYKNVGGIILEKKDMKLLFEGKVLKKKRKGNMEYEIKLNKSGEVQINTKLKKTSERAG